MKAITATWKEGQILPDAAGDWPEGCRLRVEPLEPQERIGIREEDWSNTPERIADWLEWYDSLEPLEFTPDEEADIAAWRQRVREYTIVNMDKSVENLFK
jgi:hypothetical protein